MAMFNKMETIIHYTIRDFQFKHGNYMSARDNGNMVKKSRKRWPLKAFCKTLTRIQLGLEHNNRTIEVNIYKY